MTGEEEPPIRAVAKVPKPPQQRGVARVPENIDLTDRFHLSEPEAAPVFVDDSGRRRRLLAWLSISFAVLGLALVVALWISQATSTGG
jgi:hypothetical protein